MLAAACIGASAQAINNSGAEEGEANPVKYAGVQSTSVENGTYSLRFLAVLNGDHTSYQRLGFMITADNANYGTDCTKVYSEVLSDGNHVTAEKLGGQKIFALTVKNIPVSAGTVVFRVMPYYAAADGALQYAKECTVIYSGGKHFDSLPTVRAASLNLKNNLTDTSNISWENRKANIVNFITSSLSDSIGVQECEKTMYNDLLDSLADAGYLSANKDYTNNEEYAFKNFIFYNKNTTELIGNGEYWLTSGKDSPEAKEISNYNYYISAGWAILKNIATGESYVHINTHLISDVSKIDHSEVRETELDNLLKFISTNADFSGKRIILTGDFNDKPTTDVYSNVTGVFTDSRDAAIFTTDANTYNGFTSSMSILDYCFYMGNDMSALKFNVTEKWDGAWLSDHNALVIDFAFTSAIAKLGEIGSSNEDSMTWGKPNN